MNYYTFLDYRTLILYLVEKKQDTGIKSNLSTLADAIRVQRPYVSKVMNGQADFNIDQLYLIIKYFELDPEMGEYLELLLEHSRTQLKDKKDLLYEKILKVRNIHLDILKVLKLEELKQEDINYNQYYLDPVIQVTHMALKIKKYHNTEKLAKSLHLPVERIDEAIQKLVQMRLVEIKNSKITVTKNNIFLTKNDDIFNAHQALVRLQSIQQKQIRSSSPQNYFFSVTYTGDEELQRKLKEKFSLFIKEVSELQQESTNEEVYQINFDLFSWTK
jgi:plasmid maintenance system antidote protein VapI